jgi:nitroimidazol reductase NimA-like FMN-containing flavoprotein (pyridoxamine 5'-phosphate oxidase superfamily)
MTIPSPPAEPYTYAQHRLLDKATTRAFLNTRHFGELAFIARGRAAVEPVYGALDLDFDEWMYLRTFPGSTLGTALTNPWVSMVVHDTRSELDWTRVVVSGQLYLLSPKGDAPVRKVHGRAVELLAGSNAVTGNDALTDETLFRMNVERMSGRICVPML